MELLRSNGMMVTTASERAVLQVRRRKALTLTVFLICLLVATALGGMVAGDSGLNWVAFYGWAIPVCLTIAVCTHLIKYLCDTSKV
jgi:hypothetical protein